MARFRHLLSKRERRFASAPQPITARVAIPIDPKRPSIARLPDEVLRSILRFLDNVDLRTLSLVSSKLYEVTQYVKQDTTAIDLGQRDQTSSQLDYLERNRLHSAVRTIKVSGGSFTPEDDRLLARLALLISDMSGLQDLHWSCLGTFPHLLRDRLPPRTRLHISVTGNGGADDQVLERFTALVGNQNLFSLSVHLGIQIPLVCLQKMCVLKEILLSCPRMTRIPLLYVGHIVTSGYSRWESPSPGTPYCGLGLSDGEKPPALKELGLTEYPWGHEPTPQLISRQAVFCVGYPEKGSELSYWAREFDWTQLRKLNDIPRDLALAIAPKLLQLKEVVLDAEYWEKSEFLERVPAGLEVLSIPSWAHVTNQPGPIIRHGAALRKLTIHRRESRHNPRIFLSDTNLAALSENLPHLEELVLDMSRDTDQNAWPYSSLDIVTKFPSLKSIELWFEIGAGVTASPTPYLTIFAARELFSHLRQKSSKIQRLELRSGLDLSGTPERATNLVPGLSWHWQNSAHFLCKVSIPDGDPADGYVIVTCPQLRTGTNAELTRQSKLPKEERPSTYTATDLSILVALEGPLTMENWKEWRHRQELRAIETSETRHKENAASQSFWKSVSSPLRRKKVGI